MVALCRALMTSEESVGPATAQLFLRYVAPYRTLER